MKDGGTTLALKRIPDAVALAAGMPITTLATWRISVELWSGQAVDANVVTALLIGLAAIVWPSVESFKSPFGEIKRQIEQSAKDAKEAVVATAQDMKREIEDLTDEELQPQLTAQTAAPNSGARGSHSIDEPATRALAEPTPSRANTGFVAAPGPLCGEHVCDMMVQAVEHRFGAETCHLAVPIEWLSDNGSIYTSDETRAFGAEIGFEMCTTPPYSPESNGMAESFVKSFKRDYVYLADLWTAADVLRDLAAWFDDYNRVRPHKGLRMLSPVEFRNAQLAS
jgi:hypothetical protein